MLILFKLLILELTLMSKLLSAYFIEYMACVLHELELRCYVVSVFHWLPVSTISVTATHEKHPPQEVNSHER